MDIQVPSVSRGPIEKLSEQQIEEAYNLYKENFSLREVSKRYDVFHTTLSKYFRKRGFELREGNTFNRRDGRKHGNAGKNHPNYQGGRRIDANGYVLILLEIDDPFHSMATADNLVREHRLVMARYLERPLRAEETVHHIDGNRQNNTLSNLQLRIGKHGAGQAYCCSDCGSINIIPQEL